MNIDEIYFWSKKITEIYLAAWNSAGWRFMYIALHLYYYIYLWLLLIINYQDFRASICFVKWSQRFKSFKTKRMRTWSKKYIFFWSPLVRRHLFDHCLWSTFQSSLHTYYKLQIMLDLLCGQLIHVLHSGHFLYLSS